jgi:hypothetical protein
MNKLEILKKRIELVTMLKVMNGYYDRQALREAIKNVRGSLKNLESDQSPEHKELSMISYKQFENFLNIEDINFQKEMIDIKLHRRRQRVDNAKLDRDVNIDKDINVENEGCSL